MTETLLELCPVCGDDGSDCVWCEGEHPGYVEHDCDSCRSASA